MFNKLSSHPSSINMEQYIECCVDMFINIETVNDRYKGKNRVMPVVPNQPSEASAHFMFELAKTVLIKAGGNSSTSLFVNQPASNNNNSTGPHRALHLCAFQIGLYALGLNNCVSPNWLSRTYSSHVSWITGLYRIISSHHSSISFVTVITLFIRSCLTKI